MYPLSRPEDRKRRLTDGWRAGCFESCTSGSEGGAAETCPHGKRALLLPYIEKALSGSQASGQTDSGVSARLLGTLLSWLNDHESDVFVVCTANDVSKLPPELTRAERFDGVFFLDLPGRQEKDAIWKQYIDKYGLDPDQPLPQDRDWTPAEIKSACRLAALLDTPLTEAARNIVPISATAGESVERLRNWASGRCLAADRPGIYTRTSGGSTPPGRYTRTLGGLDPARSRRQPGPVRQLSRARQSEPTFSSTIASCFVKSARLHASFAAVRMHRYAGKPALSPLQPVRHRWTPSKRTSLPVPVHSKPTNSKGTDLEQAQAKHGVRLDVPLPGHRLRRGKGAPSAPTGRASWTHGANTPSRS